MFSFNEYFLFIASYLIGSIPFGVIIANLAGLGDITKQGSGNVGATNLARVGGKKLGAATFLLDFLKSFLPTMACKYIFHDDTAMLICAGLAVIGHIFPVFYRFKGGKGVASSFGALLAINPVLFLLVLASWVVMFLITRISSMGAIFAFTMMPIYASVITDSFYVMIFTVTLSLIIYSCHLSNIKKLLNGDEKKFSKAVK